MTPEEAAVVEQQVNEQHGPEEDYASPVLVDQKLGPAFNTPTPPPQEAPSPKLVRKAAAVNAPSYLQQEAKGFTHSLGDRIVGPKQKLIHAFGGSQDAANVDEEVRQREMNYQEETPDSYGVGRFLGDVAPYAAAGLGYGLAIGGPIGGAVGAAGGAGIGVIDALMKPISEVSKKESFGKQTLRQGIEGGLAGVATPALSHLAKVPVRGGALPELPSAIKRYVPKPLQFKSDKDYAEALKNETAAWRRAGTEPTLGQSSQGGLTKDTGAFETRRTKQAAEIEANALKQQAAIGMDKTRIEGGKRIVKGAAQIKADIRTAEDDLYNNQLYKALPKDTPAATSNIDSFIQKYTHLSPTAPELSAEDKSREILRRVAGLDSTINRGTATFEDLKKYSTSLGDKINWTEMGKGNELNDARKDLYFAIRDDLKATVASKGKRVAKLFDHVNSTVEANRNFVHETINPLLEGGTPTKIFNKAKGGEGYDIAQLEQLKTRLDPTTFDDVRGAIIHDLGAGKSDKFKIKDFAARYESSLSPEAKDLLFGKVGSRERTTWDRIAEKGASVTEVTKNEFAEMRDYASQHAGAAGGLALVAAGARQFGTAKILLTSLGVGYVGGRIAPKAVIDWAARTSTKPWTALPTAINSLKDSARRMNSEDQRAVNEYVNNLKTLKGLEEEAK